MEKLYQILEELCPGVDFRGNEKLVDSGEIESLDIVMIVSELIDAYDIEIPVDQIIPENFNSVAAMNSLIKKLQGEEH